MSQKPTAVPPPLPLTAIDIVEQNLAAYQQQEQQALAQLHATQGAIGATQQLLGRLKAEEQKAKDVAAKMFADQMIAQVRKTGDLVEAAGNEFNAGMDAVEAQIAGN